MLHARCPAKPYPYKRGKCHECKKSIHGDQNPGRDGTSCACLMFSKPEPSPPALTSNEGSENPPPVVRLRQGSVFASG